MWVFPGDSDGKASACNAGDPASIPGLERSPEEGNGNLLQYSYLENSMDRGAWLATVRGITESDTTERLTLDVMAPEFDGGVSQSVEIFTFIIAI